MTHSQVYCTDKLRKNLFFDETRCVGARVENLLSGRSVDIGADKVVIVWSESGRGKKRTFDTLSASRFFGGDPEKGEPYGYYAERDGSYALMLRNPSPSPAAVSFTFPAAGTVSATLSPFEIRFSTESSLSFMSL